MGLIRRRLDYDRKWLLAEAEKARARGRKRRAIAFYRRILAAEPHEPGLHARIAPLLAATGQRFDAWQSYHRAAQAHLQNDNRKDGLALLRNATRALPHRVEAWQWLAKLELKRGAREAAIDALLEGRKKFRSRRRRPEAIALLREARSIDAWRVDVVLDLARLLRRSRQSDEAQWLLGQLAERVSGRDLRVVRGALWRVEPSLKHSWHWLRATFGATKRERAGIPARSR